MAVFGCDLAARRSAQAPRSLRMSTMTEADWDANDRDRDARYQLDKALEAVGISPGLTVGEVGAGAGHLVFKLAARVGPSGKVYVEDIKAYVLEMLKTRIRRRGLANVETVIGTPDDPRMPAATIDAIFMHATINFIDQPVGLFKALIPSLRSGGRIVVIEESREEYLDMFAMAGLKVERRDHTIAPPFTV